MATPLDILVTGGTGYIGQHLIPLLISREHRVRVLAREGSLSRVPNGATPVVGDALNAESVGAALRPGDTVVHLVGTPHPSPTKADQFDRVDLMSIRCTVEAAKRVAISHLVYVSVAQPAPVMAHYGEKDPGVNKVIPDTEAAMKKYNKTYDYKIYSGAQHAFNNDANPARYSAEASQEAWVKTLDFFKKNLKG